MSVDGCIFDIREFTVHDGPGVRTTVFLKGCPLRCRWCHNPEGWESGPQLMASDNACTRCGSCRDACPCSGQSGSGQSGMDPAVETQLPWRPNVCQNCGQCLAACKGGIRRMAGETIGSDALAKRLLRHQDLLLSMDGGVTFSGGEPLFQPDFLIDTIRQLKGLPAAIETCGHAGAPVFKSVLDMAAFFIFDIKLASPEQHKRWTGADNRLILQNLRQLQGSGKPFVVRTPMIPGVTDTFENMEAIAELCHGHGNRGGLLRIELLPYNGATGAKYRLLGRAYDPGFQESQPISRHAECFERLHLPYAYV